MLIFILLSYYYLLIPINLKLIMPIHQTFKRSYGLHVNMDTWLHLFRFRETVYPTILLLVSSFSWLSDARVVLQWPDVVYQVSVLSR